MINIQDTLQLQSTQKLTAEGFLQGVAGLTRVGVQPYPLSLITKDSRDNHKIIHIFRPPESIFNDTTKNTAKLKPITLMHPNEDVTAQNYRQYAIGTTGENVIKLDDEHLGVNIQINDQAIIDQIKSGQIKEISVGYKTPIKKSPGSYKGQAYDYILDGAMEINHCAIVPEGRCGKSVSILDQKEEIIPMTKDDVKKAIKDNPSFMDEIKALLKEAETDVKEEVEKGVAYVAGKVESGAEKVAQEAETIKEKAQNKADPQPKPQEQTEPNKKQEAIQDSAINDQINKRLTILDHARTFDNTMSMEAMNHLKDRALLETTAQKAFKDQFNIQDKSDDFLLGGLAVASMQRSQAQQEKQKIQDSLDFSQSPTPAQPYDATQIRGMK